MTCAVVYASRMGRLSRIKDLAPGHDGIGFFLCSRKEVRQTRAGGDPFLSLTLQDVSGSIDAKVFGADVERVRHEFEAGEFVKVEARTNVYNNRTELIVARIRRVHPDQDAREGFRVEDCVPTAPRSLDDMWIELETRMAAMRDAPLRALVTRVVTDHADRLRVWPAALTVHHAYRGGLVEHILQVARLVEAIGPMYDADTDLLFAGAVLHDIGKLRELEYDVAPAYSREGNLVGHIALGLMMVREAAAGLQGLSEERRQEVEHLIASHHGSRELGSPVEPMTVEAFILAMADDLDAKLHQVRRHVADDDNDGEFTAYIPRLKRVLLKPRA